MQGEEVLSTLVISKGGSRTVVPYLRVRTFARGCEINLRGHKIINGIGKHKVILMFSVLLEYRFSFLMNY